jgi:hypothetical protein
VGKVRQQAGEKEGSETLSRSAFGKMKRTAAAAEKVCIQSLANASAKCLSTS